jgi:hypothetical protein
MTHPWDQFPIPYDGDEDDAHTYEGVGRVMTAWESVEFDLSRLYSIFAGDPDGQVMTEYGQGRIFRDRITALRLIASKWFLARPNQALEGDFDRICAHAEGFSLRRNEIAHGIVMQVDGLLFFRMAFKLTDDRPRYACIPPYYAFRNADSAGNPLWAYTRHNAKVLERMLWRVVFAIDDYRKLLTDATGSRQEPPLPSNATRMEAPQTDPPGRPLPS